MKKFIVIFVAVISLLLAAVPFSASAKTGNGNQYNDISGKWFTDAAEKFGYTEVFSDGSGKFYPNKKITRIEFVRLLHKALDISIYYFAAPDVSKDFNDMKNTDTGAYELIDLATTGIIERGGSFYPDKKLDRDLMLHWIINALDYKTGGNYALPKRATVPFKDDNRVTEAYKDDIYKAQLLSLVFGRGNNLFVPRDGATRAEAVIVVMRLMTLLNGLNGSVGASASAVLEKSGLLNMKLTIQNNTSKSVTISHTSGQHYDFKLFDVNGNNVYTWSADKLFIASLGTTELKPGESLVFSDTVSNADYSAIMTAVTMKAFIVGTSNDFTIDTNGYETIIEK